MPAFRSVKTRFKWIGWPRSSTIALVCSLALLRGVVGSAQENAPLTETEVKALCILNFAKYVDWPSSAVPPSGGNLTIGVIDSPELADTLERLVKAKLIGGRVILIRRILSPADIGQPQIIFVGSKKIDRVAEFLSRTKNLPVLTVGENPEFEDAGGIVTFVIRNGRVRFGIDLNAAAGTGLRISSKLLTLADEVRGKT